MFNIAPEDIAIALGVLLNLNILREFIIKVIHVIRSQ